jgi:hypothetical protein
MGLFVTLFGGPFDGRRFLHHGGVSLLLCEVLEMPLASLRDYSVAAIFDPERGYYRPQMMEYREHEYVRVSASVFAWAGYRDVVDDLWRETVGP